jgi:hypothetical protein
MSYSSRISALEQQMAEQAQAVPAWTHDMVETRPLAVMCTVFAAGFVLGAGIVAAVATGETQTPLRSGWRRDLERFAGRTSQDAELLSDRIVDAVSRALPHQLSDLWQKS